MKRIVAGLLTMVMLLSMMMPVFAEETTGSITITNTVAGQTYSLYKVFNLESYSGENFSYKVCDNWKPFFEEGAGAQYIALNNGGYIESTSLNDQNMQAFSKTALAWAKEKGIGASCSVEAKGDSVYFKKLPLGYYLVDSTLGTLCTINTNIPDMEFSDKNQEATLTYTIKNDDDSFVKIHNADMNSTLTYKIEVSAMPGAENYQIYVKKPEGIKASLELDKDIFDKETIDNDILEVLIQPKSISYDQDQTYPMTLKKDEHYELLPEAAPYTEDQDPGHNFGIAIKQEVLDQINAAALITITYKAHLNTEAACSENLNTVANTSTAWLTFGESSMTDKDETHVYTYHLPIFKYTKDANDENQPLAGAEFRLCRKEEGKVEYASFDEYGNFVGWSETESDANIVTSGENGMIDLCGLATGEYSLEETAAPAGYNKLLNPISVRISAGEGKKVLYAQEGKTTEQINVLNNTGSQLPSTGGMGTKIFYALGATMFVSAVILLVVRKRMSK